MKTFRILILLIFFAPTNGTSQTFENGTIKSREWHNHIFRVGITPSAVINENLGFQVNAAVNLTSRIQVNMEAGKIMFATISDISSISGYRIRPALRYYILHENDFLLHASLAYNRRRTSIQKIRKFILLPQQKNIIAQFNQKISMDGIAAMMGIDIDLAGNIIVDLGFGVGLSDIDVENMNVPENSIRPQESFDKYEKVGEQYPLIILNMRIQYVF